MESLFHALSAVKTCVQAHGTDYQKDAFDFIFKKLEELVQLPTTQVKSSAGATSTKMPTSCDECPISQICSVNYCKGKMCREAWSALLLT